MPAGQATLTLLLELKNKLKGGLNKATDSVSSTLGDLKGKINSFSSANAEAFNAIKNEIPGVGRAISLITNPYVMATAAVLAFGAATAKSVNMALDWENSLARVNVTTQLAKPQLKTLSDQILTIGGRGSTELEQVPLAFNRIISAGLDVNTSLKALEPTLRAAKAGFTDVETVAAAGVGVMNSSGEEINKVYDILFATLNKGNAEFKDIAQYLPKIIPGAKNAGFSLAEVGGAFAFLTAKGQTAEQTTTGLLNTFKAFSKPETIKGFKSIGVDIFDANRNTKPFMQIIQELSKSLGSAKNKESFIGKFSQIGLDQDAVAAVASMIQNVDDLKTTMDFTKNSAGQLDQAFENARTSTDGWKEGMNKFKVLAIKFGQQFLPLVRGIGEGFKTFMGYVEGGVDWVKKLYGESVLLQDIVSGIGTILSIPFRIIGGIFGTIKDLVVWLNDKIGITSTIGKFFQQLEYMWIGLKATASGVMTLFQDLWSVIKPIGSAIANLTNPVAFSQAINEARTAFANFNFGDSFKRGFQESLKESFAIKNATDKKDSLIPEGVGKAVAAQSVDASGIAGASSAASKIGEAHQNKSIVVQIGALHQGDNTIIQSPNGEKITMDEFERMMNEVLLRVVRNVEASY